MTEFKRREMVKFKRKLIPFLRPQLSYESFINFLSCVVKSRINREEDIYNFEKRFAKYIGSKYAITFSSGRYCLYLLYKFFNCSNKNVILPAYTCIPAANSVLWANAKPLFTDIELGTYNMVLSPKLRKIKNIGAILPTYLYGLVGKLDEILDFAEKMQIPLIEDAAIAIGAEYKNKKVGSIGDAAMFSLQNSKILSGWRGGIITTDNEKLAEFLINERKKLPYQSSYYLLLNISFIYLTLFLSHELIYGLTMFPFHNFLVSKDIRGESVTGKYSKDIPESTRKKISSLQTSIANFEFNKIGGIIEKRRRNASYFTKHLKDIVITPEELKNSKHVYGRYPIRIPGFDKFEFGSRMLEMGVEVIYNYPYICPNILYKHNANNVNSCLFPNSLTASRETVLLPIDPHLKRRLLSKIKDCVILIVGGKKFS